MSYSTNMRLAAIAAMGLLAATEPVAEAEARVIRMRPEPMPDMSFTPRGPRSARQSKYMPHQGKREMERRRKRISA